MTQPTNSTKKHVQYITTDVLTEAKSRIRNLLYQFDQIWVAFSGGKDSLVCVELVEEVYREEGIKAKVNVVFRDEELIPDVIIDFVKFYAEQTDRFNFRYLAVPMKVGKFIMGKHLPFTAWDPDREWHRQPPEYAERNIEGAAELYENDMDGLVFQGYKGKIAVITGVRADESLKRYQSCVIKKNDNYLVHTSAKHVMVVKPIYDWSETDVFKYFYDRNIKYCPVYDSQMWAGSELRVASLLHERAISNLLRCKRMFPVFYNQIIGLMPEVETQVRYWEEHDAGNVFYRYPHTFDGMRQYVETEIDLAMRPEAHKYIDGSERFRKQEMKVNPDRPLGGLPVLYIFQQLVRGTFVKAVIGPLKTISSEHVMYESEDHTV
jgi:predicted phosphoadenosine phosphosulfate sulfurtransferase